MAQNDSTASISSSAMKKALSRDLLKYIAIIGMTMQHLADKFFVYESLSEASLLYWLFYIAGGITAPLMCYFLAEGYQYTRSKKKYAARLFVFAVIAQLPYALFWEESFLETIQSLNIIFNLLICFGALVAYEKIENKILKWALILACAAITYFFCEWSAIPVLWVVWFYIFRSRKKLQLLGFAIGGLLDAGPSFIGGYMADYLDMSHIFLFASYLIVPLLAGFLIYYFYSGKKGRYPVFSKWVFYVYYPLHFLILHVIYSTMT